MLGMIQLIKDNPSDKASNKFSVDADGRGTISLTISNPMRSNGGNYKCTIVRCGKPYPHDNKLCVHWIDIVQVDEELEEGDTFVMECKYEPVDKLKCISDCIWKKLHEDGTSTSISEGAGFEITTDNEKGNSLLRISKVTLADTGEYQCIVKSSCGKLVVANGMLVVVPFRLTIPDIITYEGVNIERLYLKFTTEVKASLEKISDIRWYKGESRETVNFLANLNILENTKRYTAGLKIENSQAFLDINDITSEDAGKYCCEVVVKGSQSVYLCTGYLKVEGPLLRSVNEGIKAIKGENVELCWELINPLEIKSYAFYKRVKDELREVALPGDTFFITRCKANYILEDRKFILTIFDVECTDNGSYICQCVTKNSPGDRAIEYSSKTICLTVDLHESMKMPYVIAFEGEKSATFKCDYRLKSNVAVQRWIKKTSKGNQVIYNSENWEKFKTKTEVQKYEADFDQNSAQLKINQVEVADAGVYSCEVVLKKFPTNTQRQTSANLVVPLDVFGSALVHENPHVYRHPAVVFADMHFFVFCEEQVAENYTKGLLRRGKLKKHNRIEWEPQQPILDMINTRFENLVPIVVDEKEGDVILVCVEHTAQQDGCKLVQLRFMDKKPWSDKADVNLKWPKDMQNGAEICFIGPGHGLCLQSGHLAVAGFIKFSEHVHLCMIISDNKGETWEVVPILSSSNIDNVSFGNHAQIVEYAKNQVCITCSLGNCQQRFNVFLNDKYKTRKDRLEPKLIEANPGCQVGIVSIPVKDKKKGGFNFVAFTNPADKSHFKDLSVRLSKDGCGTWTDPLYTLGRKFAKSSDLAYYEEKGFFTDDKGIACVYENINTTDDMNNNCYSIVMQLISLD